MRSKLLMLALLFSLGAPEAIAQEYTRTFDLKGLEEGNFRVRVFLRPATNSEGKVVPLQKRGQAKNKTEKPAVRQINDKVNE